MNNTNLIGRLTKDVDIHITESGTNVGRFILAVNRPYVKEGEDKQQADFISCVAFNKTALNLSEHCEKGSKIAVEGRLQSFKYDKDGVTNFGQNVVANRIEYLSHPIKPNEQKENNNKEGEGVIIEDGDLPFD